MKFLKYFFVFLIFTIIIIFNIAKAKDSINFTTSVKSSWDIWDIQPFKHYSNKLCLYGNTYAILSSNAENSLIKLYFGITSSSDGNFNFIYNKEILLYGNLYLDTSLSINSDLKFGFIPGDLNKTSIIEQRKYTYGLPLLALYKSYDNLPVFDGSYMQNNHAFSINYSKTINLGTTVISISYIPNLDCNLSSNSSFYRKLQKHLGAGDISLNFYDEYDDIGYGVITAARIYYRDVVVPKGAEAFISSNIDYLGFGTSLSFLSGFISGMECTFKYQLTEISLYYKIAEWVFMGTYSYNNINSGCNYNKYYYNTFNLGVDYKLNKNLFITTSYFYHKTKNYAKNQGLAIGVNFNI